MKLPDDNQRLEVARRCLAIESDAITATAAGLDLAFPSIVARIHELRAQRQKLLCSGVGKNAFIAQKVAGTFNSIGMPTAFLDPLQAVHGDLGLATRGDLAILFSHSGETDEMLQLVPPLRRLGVEVVAITADAGSRLAHEADHVLTYAAPQEACPLQLAPTASTTAALALGDALAMVVLEESDFNRDDFARLHPAGTLGRRLLLRVGDIMRRDDRFASGPPTLALRDAILRMTEAKCGILAVTDEAGRLIGVFTDGDFRRTMLADPKGLDRTVGDIMTPEPKRVQADALAVEAVRAFENFQVNDLIVVDSEDRPVGLVDGQDLPRLRIV